VSIPVLFSYCIIDSQNEVIKVDVFSLILVATAVSIDGFWGGFAFGLRKVKINGLSLIIISFWSIVCTMGAMLIGYNLKSIISANAAKYIGAFLLFLLGLFTLKEGYNDKKNKLQKNIEVKFNIKDLIKVLGNPTLADFDHQNDIKPLEGTLLGIAVAMDASIAAFTVALLGFSPLTTPFLFGLTHFILIGIGNIVARNKVINAMGQKLSMLPGIILIVLAILRLV
jgi:putative sporulation protein YtaF